jgi:VIT1/CCC1 family predicted Fe2+/Mn2+ transporter
MSVFTKRPPWWSGLRMLLVGAVAAGVTFAVGRAFHVNGL